MVVVKFNKSELLTLSNVRYFDELYPAFEILGIDIKREDDSSVDLELYPDRPDLIPIEGIARAINHILYEKTKITYTLKRSTIEVFVDKELQNIRPYIVMALIKNLKLSEQNIKDFMETQEKLHLTMGRKRVKVAIGLHDFDKVTPPFYYIAADPDSFAFEPLGLNRTLTLSEILELHPKGIEYRKIISAFPKYPLIIDSKHRVLSFPPIINSSLTEVTKRTKSILIDCTGTDLKTLIYTLNILVTAFDYRGGVIYRVIVHYPSGDMQLPELRPLQYHVSKKAITRLLGITLTDAEIATALKKTGYSVKLTKSSVRVKIPAYRNDIMHENDVIEDIAKGYGYGNFPLTLPESYTTGTASPKALLKNKYRTALIGMQFLEVTTLSLTRKMDVFKLQNNSVEILNPVTEEQSIIRSWLIPSLMRILQKNRHNPLPQKIFEIGEVVNNNVQETHVALAAVYSKAGFTDIKSYVETLYALRGMDIETVPATYPFMIEGRSVNVQHNTETIGFFGEVHPEILEKFDIMNPTIVFESKLI